MFQTGIDSIDLLVSEHLSKHLLIPSLMRFRGFFRQLDVGKKRSCLCNGFFLPSVIVFFNAVQSEAVRPPQANKNSCK